MWGLIFTEEKVGPTKKIQNTYIWCGGGGRPEEPFCRIVKQEQLNHAIPFPSQLAKTGKIC